MKRWHRRHSHEELNIWQPATDMFSGLVLILLLVILLLSLYLVNALNDNAFEANTGSTTEEGNDGIGAVIARPDTSGGNQDAGGTQGGGEGTDPDGSLEADQPDGTTEHDGTTDHDGGAGGGGGGTGTGTEPDEGIKSAVFVEMIDAETERTIKEAGVEFELYGLDNALQILNVYYPEKISFRKYETTEAGTFYFPEKLLQGQYTVHELTEPEGYDAAENQTFDLNDLYDWPEPYVVRIPLSPSKNVIRIQMNDAETQAGVGGGSFDVIAAADVLTQDGTLRYHEGEIVDEILCDENGAGTSQELYLGEYTVREKTIPRYYTGQTESLSSTVEKKTEVEAPLNTLETQRSRIVLQVADELYTSKGVEGAAFQITGDDGTEVSAVTDASGKILLEELEKNTTYTIRQSTAPENYRIDSGQYTVYVSADGRIDGEAQKELTLTNRVLRVNIGAASNILGGQRAGVELSLYDSSDNLLHTWTTTNAPITFTDLQTGSYYVTMDNDTEKHYTFQVADQVQIQTVNVGASKVLPYILAGGGAIIALVILVKGIAAILGLIKKRKKKDTETGR